MLSLTVYPIIWLVVWGAFLAFTILMVVRLILTYADPNPFGAVGRFAFNLRKATEKFVYPAARLLANYRVDVRLAPLVVIFVTLIITYFSLSVLGNAFFIIDGLSLAISSGNVKATIGYIIHALLSIFVLFILIRFISAWFVFTRKTFLGFVKRVTDPIILPAQRMIPPVGMFDLSAMVVLIVIWILQAIVMAVLIKG